MNLTQSIASLEELRALAADALHVAGLDQEASNLRKDPAITDARRQWGGWAEWTRTLRDAHVAIVRQAAIPRKAICTAEDREHERAIDAAGFAIDVLDSAMAAFATELLKDAMRNDEGRLRASLDAAE